VKVGDLVLVTFPDESPLVGIFLRDDVRATGIDKDGYPVVTRAYVLWDGEACSTPLEQLEPICPVLSDEQLENVVGGLSAERLDQWRAEKLNESR